jgi:hypothetical protein
MSRIRLSWNHRVFISKRQLFPNPDDQSTDISVITNIVYHNVLQHNCKGRCSIRLAQTATTMLPQGAVCMLQRLKFYRNIAK